MRGSYMYGASVVWFYQAFIFVLVTTIVGCATVPETGRSQLRLISAEQEIKLGLTEFDKLKKSTPIAKDSSQRAMLQRVGNKIPMPDYMREQMPELMPKVMDNLMPHMIGDVVPLVTGPMIKYLRGQTN